MNQNPDLRTQIFDEEGERGGLLLRGSARANGGRWSVGRGSMVAVGGGDGRWWTFSDPTMVFGEREKRESTGERVFLK